MLTHIVGDSLIAVIVKTHPRFNQATNSMFFELVSESEPMLIEITDQTQWALVRSLIPDQVIYLRKVRTYDLKADPGIFLHSPNQVESLEPGLKIQIMTEIETANGSQSLQSWAYFLLPRVMA